MADEKKTTGVEENDEIEKKEVDEGNPSNDEGDGGEDNQKKTTPSEKTFTQSQVNKMMAREKGQGRTAALNELGIDPKNAAQVAAVKAFIESQKTDAQKEAERQAAEADARAKAEERAAIAEAKAEAMLLGVQKQFVDDVVILAMSKMAAVEGGDLKTIIGELKTKYPVWFGQSAEEEEDEGKKKGQKGTGSSVKPDKTSKKGKDGEPSLGARLAAQRKVGNKQSSYWGKK